MEEALRKLELLIHHTGVNRETATRAFLDACRKYAETQGFDLDKDCMAIHRAFVPTMVQFDEAEEHIIVHENKKYPLNTIVFFRESFFQE